MPNENAPKRPPLTNERIMRAAVDLVDRNGLDALTMRRLGTELGVEAMSLYKHVANKEAILDGIVELVLGEIEIPTEGANWREAMRRRAVSARDVFSRHSWAIGLLEARNAMGPTALRFLNAVLGNLRSAGFSIEDAAHAFWLLDSFVYGHVVHETSFPFSTSEETTEPTRSIVEQITTDEYPHVVEIGEHALTHEYSFDNEFEFGLDLILDALDRTAIQAKPRVPAN
jgi:AcrR family transcriptional regulator